MILICFRYAVSFSGFTRVAAGLSNAAVQIFELSNSAGLKNICDDCVPVLHSTNAHKPISICGVKFLDETPNCLLVGTSNGLVRLFDLGLQKEEARFECKATEGADEGEIKTINCFDINCNGRVLCSGTAQHENNVYVIFHDVR